MHIFTCPTSFGLLGSVMSYCLMSPWIQLLKYRNLSSNEIRISVIRPRPRMTTVIIITFQETLKLLNVYPSAKQTKLICTNCSLFCTRFTFCSCFAVICFVTQFVSLTPPLMCCVNTQIKATKDDERTPHLAFPVVPSLQPSCLGLWWQFQNPRNSSAKYHQKSEKLLNRKVIKEETYRRPQNVSDVLHLQLRDKWFKI